MPDFPFDMSTSLSPGAGIGLSGAFSNLGGRPSARFDHHLDQATRPPDEYRPAESRPSPPPLAGERPPDAGAPQAARADRSTASDDNAGDEHDDNSDSNSAPAEAHAAAVAGSQQHAQNTDGAAASQADEEAAAVEHGGKATAKKAKKIGKGLSDNAPAGEAAPPQDGKATDATAQLPGAHELNGELSNEGEQPDQKESDHNDGHPPLDAPADENAVQAGVTAVEATAAASPAKPNGQNVPAPVSPTASDADAIAGNATDEQPATAPTRQSRAKKGSDFRADAPSNEIAQALGADSAEGDPSDATTDIDLAKPNDAAAAADGAPAQKTADAADSRPISAPFLLASRTESEHDRSHSEALTDAQRGRFVHRVASAFRMLGDEGGEVRLRLSPPELGAMRIELSVRDGVLSARLETETTTARSILLDNLPALRDRLAEQNIKVERFDVDVRDEQRQAPGEQFARQPGNGRSEREQARRVLQPRTAAAPVTPAPVAARKPGDARELNIII
jgi:flagellar hook-length control protein FliK